tara:strand:+ start:106 stop:315 length:210 start_codon:yes stop_codon:yes gene_type:complete
MLMLEDVAAEVLVQAVQVQEMVEQEHPIKVMLVEQLPLMALLVAVVLEQLVQTQQMRLVAMAALVLLLL